MHQSISNLCMELQTKLGQRLVAYAISERNPRRVGRFASGEEAPSSTEETKLCRLADVVHAGMPPETLRAWMIGSNPNLNDQAPIEVFREGRMEAVVREAQDWMR